MKKSTSIVIALLLLCSTLLAQHHGAEDRKEYKEKIKSMKIAFITEKMDLTPEEAQQFWPVYNEYENKRETLLKEKWAEKKKNKENQELSNEEIKKHIENHFVTRQKELDLDKEYHTKFLAVLPIKKVGALYMAREQFKRDLLKKMKNHKQGEHHREGHPAPPAE
ncbi:MAG: hypothetical protein J5I47_06860 [Vicingus serpentipes]|nr:hypothetical protein [Vicingus serpentipes]